MIVIKVIVWVVALFAAAYPGIDPEGELLPFLSRWSSRKRKVLFLLSAAMLAAGNLVGEIQNDKKMSADDARRAAQFVVLSNEMSFTSSQLSNANMRIASQERLLESAHRQIVSANASISNQSRSIGSLVFNLGTSIEGKRRFARCFQDLSRITSRRNRALVYEGLICDDGVAMFGFEEEPERLKEFYFFTEAEINYALSGTPLEDHFIDKDGKANVRVGSELDLIAQMIESKLPPWCNNEIEREKAVAKIDECMRTVLRYAYRSVSTTTDWWRNSKTHEIVSRRVAFTYDANPLAEELHPLMAEIELSKIEMKSYFGLSIRDFNTRFIDCLYARGIEPKVRVKDVQGLNQRVRECANRRTSPYRN